MIHIQIFAIILLLINETQLSLQRGQGYCKNEITHSYDCCYNYENITDVCTECRNGTVSQQGKRCLPCENTMYGHKCLYECKCEHQQRCDAEVGCIWNTTRVTIHEEFTTTQLFQDSTPNITGEGIFIYILCVVGIIFIIGSCHLLRTHRNRLLANIRKVNEGEEIEMRQERVEQLYMEIDSDI